MADLHRAIEIFQSDSGGTPFSSGGDMQISDLHDTMRMRRTKREQTLATSTIVDSIINNPTVVDNSTIADSITTHHLQFFFLFEFNNNN